MELHWQDWVARVLITRDDVDSHVEKIRVSHGRILVKCWLASSQFEHSKSWGLSMTKRNG
jgi:hypothetical protein